MCFFQGFIVSAHTFRVLIHFEFVFVCVWCEVNTQLHSSVNGRPLASFVENEFYFPLYMTWHTFLNQLTINVEFISGPSIPFHYN